MKTDDLILDARELKEPFALPEKLMLSTRETARLLSIGEDRLRLLSSRKHDPLLPVYIPGTKFPKYFLFDVIDYLRRISPNKFYRGE